VKNAEKCLNGCHTVGVAKVVAEIVNENQR
jgi:hypothetical protein